VGPLSNRELRIIQQQVSTSPLEQTASDMFLEPITEGLANSPVGQLMDFAGSGLGDAGTLTPQEANEKYGLVNTPVAFKDTDGNVSERRAKHVQNTFLDRQMYDAKREEMSEQFGSGIEMTSNFVGNLAGGMLDPINVGTGVAAARIGIKLGLYAADRVAATTVQHISRYAARDLVAKAAVGAVGENLITSTAMEYSFGKLQEYANNAEVSTQDRIFGILAGTVLGAGIHTGMTYHNIKGVIEPTPEVKKVVKHEAIKARQLNETYGDTATELLTKTQEHAIAAEANNVHNNPEFIKQKIDIELFDRRSWQEEYRFNQIDEFTIPEIKFYKATRQADENTSTHMSGLGVGFSDNYNYVHNNIARHGVQKSNNTKIGHFSMKDATILTDINFAENKNAIATRLREATDTLLEAELSGRRSSDTQVSMDLGTQAWNKNKAGISKRVLNSLESKKEGLAGHELGKVTKTINDIRDAIHAADTYSDFKDLYNEIAAKNKLWNLDADKDIKAVFREMRMGDLNLGIADIKSLDNVIDHALASADTIAEFRDAFSVMIAESNIDIDVDGLIKSSLKALGFDGVHMVADVGSPRAHNMVYLFDDVVKKARQVESGNIVPLDLKQEMTIASKLKKLELDEMDRFQQEKQRLDFVKEMEEITKEIQARNKDRVNDDITKLQTEMEFLGLVETAPTKADAAPTKSGAEAEPPKKLGELDGMYQALITDEDPSIVKDLAACLFKRGK
jgi:hypothetical protein